MHILPVKNSSHPCVTDGFTLIELAIVLVIIGLIVGGVLVGQDLIRAASVRAQITQIEKFNTAVNTFRGKYGALPGDLNQQTAATFGFQTRGFTPGEGDGNGVIEGTSGGSLGNNGFLQSGETLSFWVDLTVGKVTAPMGGNLIEGSFTAYPSPGATGAVITSTNAANYYPPAKIGQGNSVYVYSTGSVNYWGIAPVRITTPNNIDTLTASIKVQQAYAIDTKMDDGFPASGNVTATWDSGTLAENAAAPTVNAAASDSATSCYNSSTTAGAYSITVNNGANPNCALSFRFQ